MEKSLWTTVFENLGCRLASFGSDDLSREAIRKAVEDNPWFTEDSIRFAVNAICETMLDPARFALWEASYPGVLPAACTGKKLGIIMAGNIPLVGFADLLYGLACGCDCYVKPSSKDRALITYIAGLLKDKVPQIYLCDTLEGVEIDMLIATGSDGAIASLKNTYRGVHALWRGTRSSVAVLSGNESEADLRLLADDIFTYCGLGCRNVSRIFVPRGYDMERLAAIFATYSPVHPKYRNNHLQNKALRTMNGDDFIDGGWFILRRGDDFPTAISEITYSFYDDPAQVGAWLSEHDPQLQCVVASGTYYPGSVAFGQAQYPTLLDYPDRRDVVRFICGE